MAVATLTSKGQLTIPKEVREHFHLASGDRLEFVIEESGRVSLHPLAGSVGRLYGMLRQQGRPSPSDQELEEAIIETLSMEDERIRRGGE